MSDAVAAPQLTTGHPAIGMNTTPSIEDLYTLVSDLYSIVVKYADAFETIQPVVAQLKAHPTPSPFELLKILRDVL